MDELTVDYKEEKKDVHCSVCGRNLVASNGIEIIAMAFSVINQVQDKEFESAWRDIS